MPVVFDRLIPPELRPIQRASSGDGIVRVELAHDVQISIRAFTLAELRPVDRYECLLVSPHHKGQNQFVALNMRGDSTTIGYLFPLAALADDSVFDGWPGKYARVAVETLLLTDLAIDHLAVQSIDQITDSELPIGELFDSNLGVVVLGKDNLAQVGTDSGAVALMIQENGIRVLRRPEREKAETTLPDFNPKMSIRAFSADLNSELQQFCSLLGIAAEQSHLPARFLILYQVIEALISRVYERAVGTLLADANLRANVWELKEKFEQISREKHRINKLFTEHLVTVPGEFGPCADELKVASEAFLLKSDPTLGDITKSTWIEVLYRARNLIVHRQWQMQDAADAELHRVCCALEAVYFHLFHKFVIPANPMIPASNPPDSEIDPDDDSRPGQQAGPAVGISGEPSVSTNEA